LSRKNGTFETGSRIYHELIFGLTREEFDELLGRAE
jgi:hypothetical protein